MDVVPVLVAYHSIHWIRVAVESYLLHFPEDRLLVIDNNPGRGEEGWVPDCVRERAWLEAHPGVILVANPEPPDGLLRNRTHGAGLDLALQWCRRHDARVMVHLEPDCLVAGRQWRDNLLEALARGAWMAGSVRQCHGPIHPTPTAWLVDEVRASFRIAPWKGRDESRSRFDELVHPEALGEDRSPMGVWIGWTRYWDTGHKAWFEAAVLDRTALVETPDFTHFWHGSYERRCSESTMLLRNPEARPFVERARARLRPTPVEECPFRTVVTADDDIADCGLLREVSGVEAAEGCLVGRDTCLACCASFEPSPEALNPVVASHLFLLADRVIRQGGVAGCDVEKAGRLREEAESQLDLELR